MLLYRLLLIVCLVLKFIVLSHAAFSQPAVINKGSRHLLQRLGQSNSFQSNPVGEQIIREYATALAANPENLNVVFQGELNLGSAGTADNQLSVRYRVINGSVRGDTYLKGFNVADVLMPDAFHAKVLLSAGNGDTLLYEDQRSLRLNGGTSAYVRFQLELPAEIDTVWFEIRDVQFYHENQSITSFFQRIQHIADYYAADYLLTKTSEQLSAVNCRQPDLLPQCFFGLTEAERVLRHISRAGFPDLLSLGVNDPVSLQKRFDVVRNTQTYLKREFDRVFNSTKRIYLTLTEEELAKQYVNGIAYYMEDNPGPGFASAPFINRLSSIDFAGDGFDQFAYNLKQLAVKINPDMGSRAATEEFLSMVYHAMLLKAGDYLGQVEYNQAIVMLENAASFCNAFEEIACREDAAHELSKARHGLFGFYLSVAGKAIEMQRPDIASSYVFLARDYQHKNSDLIIHDGKVMVMLIRLFDAYVLEAMKFNRSGNFDSAMIMLNRAVEPDINVTPSATWHTQYQEASNGLLAGRIAFLKHAFNQRPVSETESMYHGLMQFVEVAMKQVQLTEDNKKGLASLQDEFARQLVDAAGADMAAGFFEESLRKLLLLRNMDEGKYRNQEVDSLSVVAGREVINMVLEKTITLINQGKTDEAFELYSQARQRSIQYGLSGDEVTEKQLTDIFNAYLAVKCVQLQSQLEKTYAYAERLVSAKLFIKAVDTLNLMLSRAEKYQACRLDLNRFQRFLNKYDVPADFQSSLQMAEDAFSKRNFSSCLNHIENAEKLSEQSELGQYGLESFTMLDYAQEKQSNALNWYVARRYVQLFKYQRAFDMLDMLQKSGVKASDAAELQQELGELLGVRDRSEVSFFQSFSKQKEYTGGSSWYRPFNRAYRKGLGYRFPWIF